MNLNKEIGKLIAGVVAFIFIIIFISNSVTTVSAGEIVVKQNFLDGHLQVWSTPGVHMQNFGRLTTYKRSAQYWFIDKDEPLEPAKKEESAQEVKDAKTMDGAIKVRFNDGGHGNISGSLRFDLPTDEARMVKLHSTYGSMEAIAHELIKQVVSKSVFMTGPLMSSRESYAEKRADLINFISDQILHGVYRTTRHTIKTVDVISGQEKTIDIVEPKTGPGPNGIEREEISPIEIFGFNAYNITINAIRYDPQVEEQIKQQQSATMAVQQAMVDARKAEQAAITTAKQGEAEAAKAKWAQEVEKAKAVTAAEQQVAVAELELKTAKLSAEQTMTEAKAGSDAKKLAIQADNALQTRLNAYVEVQKAWASAYGAQRQTPDVQLGAGTGGVSQGLVELLTAKTAKDLHVSTK